MNWVLVFLMMAAGAAVAVLLLIARIVAYYRGRYAQAMAGLVCPRCGYSQHGADADHCPECGAAWGVGARDRTPAWIELSIVLIFLLCMLFILPALMMLVAGLSG
jgi:ribosomal protein L37E